MSADQLIRAVEHGYRLPRPLGCPEGLYQIMTDCWQFAPADRPDFIEVSASVSLLSAHGCLVACGCILCRLLDKVCFTNVAVGLAFFVLPFGRLV